MILSEIDSKVTELTQANTTSYPNANRLINLNIWNQNVVTEILQAQDSSDFDDQNYTGYSILDSDLVANQRDYNFGISDGVVEVKRVEVTYDGITSQRAVAIDSNTLDISLEEAYTDIDTRFSKTYPAYGWKNNSLFLYPKPTETTGKVFAEVSRVAKDFELSDYTTGTATLGFDKNFHIIVPYGISKEYFLAKKRFADAQAMDQVISYHLNKLKKQYGNKNREYSLNFQPLEENYE